MLYDRDHYKLALGQLHTCRTLIDNISRDYLRMLKYGESLFACKSLKRAALGRMATLMRKQGATLQYLEDVRKHLSRLPSIDPSERTLLLTGFPNVGKSSFINTITRADVDVQPYAFTTKSLFVGHCDYKLSRWQVIDSPGILDHSLEERNTIEMTAITALAHLHASILFLLDTSETCGFSIDTQLGLLRSIKPLFMAKPLLVVATKTDITPWEELPEADQRKIEAAVAEVGGVLTTMSSETGEGVMAVRNQACDMLAAVRVERKKASAKVGNVLNRITVTQPRSGQVRAAAIPASVLAARAAKAAEDGMDDSDEEDRPRLRFEAAQPKDLSGNFPRGALDVIPAPASAASRALPTKAEWKPSGNFPGVGPAIVGDMLAASTGARNGGMAAEMLNIVGTGPGGKVLEKDREQALGGPGVYRVDWTRDYLLENPEWRHDVMPEIMDGKNVMDFIDPDIAAKLEQLEEEEDRLLAADAAEAADAAAQLDEDHEAVLSLADAIRGKRKSIRIASHIRAKTNGGMLPKAARLRGTMSAAEVADAVADRGRSAQAAAAAAAAVTGVKRGRARSRGRDAGGDEEDMEGGAKRSRSKSVREPSRARSKSVAARAREGTEEVAPGDPYADSAQKKAAKKLARQKVKEIARAGRRGESDRLIGTARPKHLFSGKRGLGTSDWR